MKKSNVGIVGEEFSLVDAQYLRTSRQIRIMLVIILCLQALMVAVQITKILSRSVPEESPKTQVNQAVKNNKE